MKQSLQIKASQRLALTPQLQQAIKLLQLSSIELHTEIQNALETNPFLELDESENEEISDAISNLESITNNNVESTTENIPTELPIDCSWDAEYDTSFNAKPAQEPTLNFTEFTKEKDKNLNDYLLEQILLSKLTKRDNYAASVIIESVDSNGYLTELNKNLLQTIQQEDPFYEQDEYNFILKLVQHLDPIGVASLGPSEAMCIQLNHLPKNTPFLHQALELLTNHLDILSNRNYAGIKKAMKVNENTLYGILDLIKTLNPRPGNIIDSSETTYVVPDVYITKRNNKWSAELNTDISPNLIINSFYKNLINNTNSKKDTVFLKNNFNDAKWFIKSVQGRNETLINVAKSIVEKQQSFMDFGDIKMKPLILKNIADELGINESTVSRITSNKYMRTPKGVYELKYFFSSHISSHNGHDFSALAVKEMIKNFIKNENISKPLSDNKLAQLLNEKDLDIARRTVAKYREQLNIPPSNERKQVLTP